MTRWIKPTDELPECEAGDRIVGIVREAPGPHMKPRPTVILLEATEDGWDSRDDTYAGYSVHDCDLWAYERDLCKGNDMSHSCQDAGDLFVPYLLGETTDDQNISVTVACCVCEDCMRVLELTKKCLDQIAKREPSRNDQKLLDEIMTEDVIPDRVIRDCDPDALEG